MSAVERRHETRTAPFAIRPLVESDVAQCAEIERDAFPTYSPPTSFRHELKKSRADYMVAWRADDEADDKRLRPERSEDPPTDNGRPLVGRLWQSASGIWSRRSAWEPGQQYLAGFVGAWHMLDEAHIVSVGVRREYRGRGIGELLLVGAIEQARARRARVVSLEVRVSNLVAQNLYRKYGFSERGLRKGYYTDNREDAVIMTTDPILETPYTDKLRELAEAYEHRWGRAERVLL